MLPSNIKGLELTFLEPEGKNNFRAVYFVDSVTGYVGGYEGKMLKTTDGGNSWEELKTNTLAPIFDIYFIDKNKGFAVGGQDGCGGAGCVPIGNVLIKTIDGGMTWESVEVELSSNNVFRRVLFVNKKVGFVVGGTKILKTVDGGLNWTISGFARLEGPLYDIDMENGYGMAVGIDSAILLTKNEGKTWEIAYDIPVSAGIGIEMLSKKKALLIGDGLVHKTNDFGVFWKEVPNVRRNFFDVNFINSNLGFLTGRGSYSGGDFGYSYGALYYSIDGGETWIGSKTIHETNSLGKSSFPLPNLGFIVSHQKIIKVRIK